MARKSFPSSDPQDQAALTITQQKTLLRDVKERNKRVREAAAIGRAEVSDVHELCKMVDTLLANIPAIVKLLG